jgi:predicted PurR-regulated permease PerM
MEFGEYIKRALATVLLLALLWALWSARSILLLAFAAAVIAIAIAQPMHQLQKRGCKRGVAMAISVFLAGTALVLLSLWILPTFARGVGELVNDVPAAVQKAQLAYGEFWQSSPSMQSLLPEMPAADAGEQRDPGAFKNVFDWMIKSGMALAPDLLGGIGLVASILVNIALVLFIAVFFLLEPKSYIKTTLYLIPENHHARALEIWDALYSTLTKWLHAQIISITVIVLLVWLVLGVALRMPNAMVVALFAGFATFIPNIGAFLSIIPITIFTLAYGQPAQLLLYIPVYLFIQFLESNVITPQVVRSQLNIPAGFLMLFQLLITLALGALGLVLAVPILAFLIVLVREIYSYDLLGLKYVKVNLD